MARVSVSVVTPWLEHPELLEAYARVVEGADQVVVVLNGGDGAQLRAAGFTVLEQPDPLGFAASNNLGCDHATGDVVLFLNNDVVPTSVVPGAFIDQVRADTAAGGLIGAQIGDATRVQMGGNLVGLDVACAVPYVDGWCVAATRETWAVLDGPWDAESFPWPYWEDVDLSLRAIGRGLALRRAPWPVRHLGGRTAATTPHVLSGFMAQRALVEERVREVLA